jgi:uncharacterized membrane protein
LISIIYGALAVGVAMVFALVGLILVQRLVTSVQRQEHNEVAGFIYAVLGVVYAVLLALVVIAGWEDHELARETTEREANALSDIFGWHTGFRILRDNNFRNSVDHTLKRWWTRSGP